MLLHVFYPVRIQKHERIFDSVGQNTERKNTNEKEPTCGSAQIFFLFILFISPLSYHYYVLSMKDFKVFLIFSYNASNKIFKKLLIELVISCNHLIHSSFYSESFSKHLSCASIGLNPRDTPVNQRQCLCPCRAQQSLVMEKGKQIESV